MSSAKEWHGQNTIAQAGLRRLFDASKGWGLFRSCFGLHDGDASLLRDEKNLAGEICLDTAEEIHEILMISHFHTKFQYRFVHSLDVVPAVYEAFCPLEDRWIN